MKTNSNIPKTDNRKAQANNALNQNSEFEYNHLENEEFTTVTKLNSKTGKEEKLPNYTVFPPAEDIYNHFDKEEFREVEEKQLNPKNDK
jgi:hypothetical protein